MNNIFKGAKFGDKFLTRDGRIAIFIAKQKDCCPELQRNIVVQIEDCPTMQEWYLENGQYPVKCYVDKDIVSRYQEPIDENKLDELADKLNPNNPHGDNYEVGQYFGFQDGFKAGYEKAKEE